MPLVVLHPAPCCFSDAKVADRKIVVALNPYTNKRKNIGNRREREKFRQRSKEGDAALSAL